MQPSYGDAYRDRSWRPTLYGSIESRNSVHVNRSLSHAVLTGCGGCHLVCSTAWVCMHADTLLEHSSEESVRCLMSAAVVRTRRERCVLAARLQCQAARSCCLVPRQACKRAFHGKYLDRRCHGDVQWRFQAQSPIW